MAETMVDANGAGLAAIQVGVPLRLFIVDGQVAGGEEDSPPKVFINPELRRDLRGGADGRRGLPVVPRHLRAGQARHARQGPGAGSRRQCLRGWKGEGLYARALQHETDHLNGRLLIDQVGPVKRELIKRKLRKDAEAEREEAAERGPFAPARRSELVRVRQC